MRSQKPRGGSDARESAAQKVAAVATHAARELLDTEANRGSPSRISLSFAATPAILRTTTSAAPVSFLNFEDNLNFQKSRANLKRYCTQPTRSGSGSGRTFENLNNDSPLENHNNFHQKISR